MSHSLNSLLLSTKPIMVSFANKPSDPLFETIAIKKNRAQNLNYHQQRVQKAYSELFNSSCKVNLKTAIEIFLQAKKLDISQHYRLKVTYSKNGILDIQLFPYIYKSFDTLVIIEASNIIYNHKYSNRDFFNYLHQNYQADEFIITQNGFLTDATIANIALLHKTEQAWHTPKKVLLKGTTRARLIQERQIIPKDIHLKDLDNYSNIALLNAMVGFYIL